MSDVEYELPASFAQERLWVIDQVAPGQTVYNIGMPLRCRPGVDLETATAALQCLTDRHESLRAVLRPGEHGPAQIVFASIPVVVPVTDLRGLPEADLAARIGEIRFAEAAEPFDLDHAPLWRARYVRTNDDGELILTAHHAIFDGTSVQIFAREFHEACTAIMQGRDPDLPELAIQYADFAAWQRERWEDGHLDDQLAYWRARLSPLPEPLGLSPRAPRTDTAPASGGAVEFTLPPALVTRVRDLALARRTTPFAVLLAAFKAILARMSGRSDIVVGSPVAGRQLPELEPLLGNFVNTVVLRTDCDPALPFAQLVDRVAANVLDALDNPEVPYERLVEELRPERGPGAAPPLHQVVFNLLPEGTRNEQVRNGTAKVDLLMDLSEEGGAISGVVEYAAALFDSGWATGFSARFRDLLDAALTEPSTPLRRLPILLPGERDRLISQGGRARRTGNGPATAPEAFAAQVAARPDAVAVADATSTARLTYRDLDQQSARLARRLAGTARPDVPIAIFLDTGIDLAVAALAVLRAGAPYLPLDLDHPPERLRHLLADSGATAVLTTPGHAGNLPAGDHEVIDVGAPDDPGPAPAEPVHPDSLAYVIYTSGSTGRPKGVGISHRQLTAYVAGAAEFLGLGPDRSLSTLQGLTFDFSVTMFHGALLTGGTLFMVPPNQAADAKWVAEHLRRDRIDFMKITPSHLAALQGDAGRADLLPRRALVLGGEASRWDWVQEMRGLPGDCAVVNHYGPTEATVGVLALAGDRSPEGAGAITPIGDPMAHAEAYVLDEEMEPVPDGVAGELFIGGLTIARGYLGRPAATAAAFVPDPFSGRPGARLYRTGDRARRLPGGAVEFLGRADEQVKIRGYRVELGEVEAALGAHPGLTGSAVVVRDGELVGYLVGDATEQAVRDHLRERLPDPMIPTTFVRLDELPLAAHGKVDRARLPEPTVSSAAAEPPRGPAEEKVAELFRQLLGCDEVGRDDGFFELGGHSLLAIRLIGRLRKAFGVGLPVRSLFEAPTVAGIAAQVAGGDPGDGVSPIEPVPRGGSLPTSYGQRRLWFLDRLEPDAVAYNTHILLRAQGPLDPVRLSRALDRMAERHEVLRARFRQEDDDIVVITADDPGVPFETLDLTGRSELETRDRVMAHGEPAFDLTSEPPIRACLARRAGDDHLLLVTIHHVANDAWSAVLFIRELGELYAALTEDRPADLPALTVQYADYAAWQHRRVGELRDTQLEHWRRRLEGVPDRLELPTSRPRPARRGHEGANIPIAIPGGLADRLRALGAEDDASLFMVLLAGFSVLLSLHTGQDDVVVGTPAADRPHPELEPLLGFFLNTLALRNDTSGDPTFRDLLRRVRSTALDAFANAEIPFEALIEELQPRRDLGSTPLVQVMFSLEDTVRPPTQAGDVLLTPISPGTTTAKMDLTLYLRREPEQIRGIIEYRTDLFDAGPIERLAAHYIELLTEIGEEPDRRLSTLSRLTPDDIKSIETWHAGGPPRPFDPLPHQVVRRARSDAGRTAVTGPGGIALTCEEFAGRAAALAVRLRESGVQTGDVVGVCLPRGTDLVVTVHGIMAAGAAYLPLDPHDPDGRLAFLADDAAASIVVSGEPDRFPGRTVISPDSGTAAPSEPHIPALAPAYVIYTSGSTGRPKGVAVPHSALANRLDWMSEAFPIGPGDRVLHKTPFTFDVSVWELVWPLACGAELVVAPPGAQRDTAALAGVIRDHAVTMVHFVPSMLDALLDEPDLELPSLRRVICSGEALPAALAARFHERLPGVELHNLYGPTEAAIDVTRHHCAPGEELIPIGTPIRGARLEIVDRTGLRVPVGTPGELCISGAGLANGYAGRPGLTAQRFTPDPYGPAGARRYHTGDLARWLPSGELEYLGRLDHQIKVRGMRVEPGEIEGAIGEHPDVRACVVLDRGGVLTGYYVAEGGEPDLRGHLASRLPGHMIPAAFVRLDGLPVTANGKLDRAALPDPEIAARPPYEPPEGAAERALAEVWAEVLGKNRIGAGDNFFELGGDSIRSLKVVARLRARGFAVELDRLFVHQTVRELAKALTTADAPVPVAETPAFGLVGSGDLDRLKQRYGKGRP